MKFLIVDDNAEMRASIKLNLRRFAPEFRECGDGAEALETFIDFRPDWVLMDLAMPRTDGIAATRAIVAADPQAKVCIVTNYDDDELRAASRQAGARAFFVKDDLTELRRFIESQT
ncbi:MAG: response regulator transcription factor [Acidobacteria bacterium]|nr:response regulator transcription factor [Acidobacteriota bacterium]